MQIFASTTYLGGYPSNLGAALDGLAGLGLDGIELGSTHSWQSDMAPLVATKAPGELLVHNYFPPARDDLIINLASADEQHRRASIDHAKGCIAFAEQVGARLYTVHPGFLCQPTTGGHRGKDAGYDFTFKADRTPFERAFDLMTESLEELSEAAGATSVRLAIETGGSLTSLNVLLMETPEEYRRLFDRLGGGVGLNFNLAHSRLASAAHGFDLGEFIREFRDRFSALEISHYDGRRDEHRPLVQSSWVFDWLPMLPDVPWILEFRDATPAAIADSITLLHRWAESETGEALGA